MGGLERERLPVLCTARAATKKHDGALGKVYGRGRKEKSESFPVVSRTSINAKPCTSHIGSLLPAKRSIIEIVRQGNRCNH